jgi:predicted DsbA family dithiol-disulfide isomerase
MRIAVARSLGLDTAPFEACLTSDRYTDAILRSVAGAKRMGLQGTPAFIIGTLTEDGDFMRATKVMIGAENYQVFQSALDELLATLAHPASAPGLNPSK